MTLESLILEANAQGWAVALRQHPDRRDYWECSLSRPAGQIAAGIIRETTYAIADTPCLALDYALDKANAYEYDRTSPTGLALPAQSLLDLLHIKPAGTLPSITRR